jgi:Raf kinase inhibitor-like YbhB/YbcL family protein
MPICVRVTFFSLGLVFCSLLSSLAAHIPSDKKVFTISSPAFGDQGAIPARYTCQGKNLSPPLVFSNIPPETESLALIVEDPDAAKGVFAHWIVWDLPPQQTEIQEGADLPMVGKNDAETLGYYGPCPPDEKIHRYFFKLYALDTFLDLKRGASLEELRHAIQGHVIDKVELVGFYRR